MQISGMSTVVTGGASGLGRASVARLRERGARVTFCDLPSSPGDAVAQELGARFVAGDVTDTAQMNAVLDAAAADGPLRAVVHCAGRGGAVRLVERDGSPGSLETFEAIIKLNLIGSFNVLRLAAARMATADPVGEERGVLIMTASVAAYEGQIGQIPYSASKAGVVGMTVVAARDLASKLIRVCTIAPGIFDTPLLGGLSEEIRESLAASIPHPARLGSPDEYAALAAHIVENPMLNGEVIRLDGALRMAPR
jgi:NAD(P)-dependent dehydrogenase (short-subunit alcohol dehydrogenase family)